MSLQEESKTTSTGGEKTFKSYDKNQGDAYAFARKDYNARVYQAILDSHTSSGGQLGTIVDVGTGPGLAVRALAPTFDHAFGLDASDGMISTARSMGGNAKSEPIRFEVSPAEEIGSQISPPVEDGSVDLILAATAAHWFDMPKFWKAASRVLRSGGSVILLTSGQATVHPSVPNAAAVQEAIDQHRDQYLAPYIMPGNIMTRDLYANLPLPWTPVEGSDSQVEDLGFDRDSLLRKVWGVEDNFFLGDVEVNMEMFEKIMNTGSPQTRYHQAHPEDMGTERDVVKILRQKIETLLREAGVKEGKEVLKSSVPGVLVMVKKK